MVGSGTPADGKLAITLAHQMGLAVIKLPEGVTDIAFKGFTPYEGVTGEYRYLVTPDAQTTFEGNFKKDGKHRGYTTAATVATGTYKTYTVK